MVEWLLHTSWLSNQIKLTSFFPWAFSPIHTVPPDAYGDWVETRPWIKSLAPVYLLGKPGRSLSLFSLLVFLAQRHTTPRPKSPISLLQASTGPSLYAIRRLYYGFM